ncbi:hypothetical protein BKA61DRAFT_585130 [Leptodontidium sp. MPI-SDFR-AT-0119]|nr:hypothetical protein BKA61DRAFT_585130 [Leptodontidium sp. MPI-SDFR-AT-0119]
MELSSGGNSKRILIPAEILSLIFSCLLLVDIKAARCVCRTFNSLASPHLLDTAIVGSQTETIERFEAIAAHELFLKFVTTVIFSVYSLQGEYATVNGYYNDLPRHYEGREMRLPTLEQCDEHWRNHQRVINDQTELQESGDDKRRIQNALRLMPNIHHLVLSGDAGKMATHPLNKIWCPSTYRIIEPLYDLGKWQFSHGFITMSSALLSNRQCLSTLSHTDIRSDSDVLSSLCFSGMVQEIFRNLRRVALFIDDEIYRTSLFQTRVGECLAIASNLETLEIISEEWGNQTDLSRILCATWPRLYHLKLRINLGYDSFLLFCQRHKESLRSLHLQCLTLFGGSWGELVKAMRTHLRLTNIWLEDLDEGSEELWVRRDDLSGGWYRLSEAEAYVLHGGDNPFENMQRRDVVERLIEEGNRIWRAEVVWEV